jgi:hypothetical protein
MVVRNMYRPIDPIGLNFPADGRYGRPDSPCGERNTALEPSFPRNSLDFMLSQNGLAKAMSLNLQS